MMKTLVGQERCLFKEKLHDRCSLLPGKLRPGGVFVDMLGSSMEGTGVCLGARRGMGNNEGDKAKAWAAWVFLQRWHSS